jgi:thiol-disulfide isomerase/thioredoxin
MSLSDFKGKVVYIVTLSSFDVPCLNEMNSLSALQDHFANKNVALIYISFDNKKADWESNVKQFKIEGEQYLIGITNKTNEFSNLYSIKNFPQCILIDKQGNIISVNARRPSQGIEGDIEELLGK